MVTIVTATGVQMGMVRRSPRTDLSLIFRDIQGKSVPSSVFNLTFSQTGALIQHTVSDNCAKWMNSICTSFVQNLRPQQQLIIRKQNTYQIDHYTSLQCLLWTKISLNIGQMPSQLRKHRAMTNNLIELHHLIVIRLNPSKNSFGWLPPTSFKHTWLCFIWTWQRKGNLTFWQGNQRYELSFLRTWTKCSTNWNKWSRDRREERGTKLKVFIQVKLNVAKAPQEGYI